MRNMLLAGLSCLLVVSESHAETVTLNVQDAAAVYFHAENDGKIQIQADWTSKARNAGFNPVSARLVAPDGSIVGRFEEDLAESDKTSLQWKTTVDPAIAGTYRLVWTAFSGTLEVSTEPALPFAFAGFGPGLMLSPGESRFYFVIPPGMKDLVLEATSVTSLEIFDSTGESVASGKGTSPTSVKVEGKEGEVWSLTVQATGKDSSLAFAGAAPVPFASSPENAQAIGTGARVVADGIICFFPWQAEAWNLLAEYRKLPPASYQVDLPDLSQYAEAWEAEPERSRGMFGPKGPYSNLKPILAAQNLDPKSPWFGAINVWRDFDTGAERQKYPGRYFRREDAFGEDFRSGSTRAKRRDRGTLGVFQALEAANLSAIYVMDEVYNPLHKNPALLNRIVVALLQDIMMIRPSEVLEPNNTGYYGGRRAFYFDRFNTAYSRIGPYLPEAAKSIIGQAMKAVADRHLVAEVGAATNQWLSIVVGIYHTYQGSGDERYLDWTRRHLRRIQNGQPVGNGGKIRPDSGGGLQPAGYHTDGGGPDATYNGLTLSALAHLAREMNDKELVESIRRSYHFFNHTLVPHPRDETKIGVGASDFAHRTPGNFWRPQGGAGLEYMADLLPEAGLRTGLGYFTFPNAPEALEELRENYAYNPEGFFADPQGGAANLWGGHRYERWKYSPKNPQKGLLPAEEDAEFFREFGREFFFIRRGDYYAMVYAGSTMPEWMRARARGNIRDQFPQNGGGLSLLWTKEAGATLVGRNLGAFAAHSLVASQGGKEFKNDYWSTRVASFDPEEWGLTVKGKMEGLPLEYVRTYVFLPHGIEVSLVITATADVKLDQFDEILPLQTESGDPIEAWVDSKSVKDLPMTEVSRIRLHSSRLKNWHEMSLNPKRDVRALSETGTDYRKKEYKLSPLALSLSTEWKKGQSRQWVLEFTFPQNQSGETEPAQTSQRDD